jgi:hypothetical protein
MRKVIIYTLLGVLISVAGLVQASDLDEVYRTITKMSSRNTPQSYKVRVQNDSFSEALADLPDEIRTGAGEPAVMVYFKKGEGVKILIENIKSEYASLFSMYEEYLKFSGISNVQNPSELKKIIDMDKLQLYREDKQAIILKAWDPEKTERDDSYALFTLSKDRWVIEKAVYYLDGTRYVQAENKYKVYGSYYLPYEIVLINVVDDSSEVFRFVDYRFE